MGDATKIRSSYNLKRYPPAIEEWHCCHYPWQKLSTVVIHIEERHLQYKLNESVSVFKYKCCNCEKEFENYNEVSKHFLNIHVEHVTYCQQCFVKYSDKDLPEYYKHIVECNLIEAENRAQINNRTRKQREQTAAEFAILRRQLRNEAQNQSQTVTTDTEDNRLNHSVSTI